MDWTGRRRLSHAPMISLHKPAATRTHLRTKTTNQEPNCSVFLSFNKFKSQNVYQFQYQQFTLDI